MLIGRHSDECAASFIGSETIECRRAINTYARLHFVWLACSLLHAIILQEEPMATQDYHRFYAQVMELYRNQAFAEALELLTREGDVFPEEAPTILYLRSCMAARIGQPELAVQLVEEAINRGYWYGEALMRGSPSWQPLQGMPAFEQIAAICKHREAEAQTGPAMLIEAPAGGQPADHPRPLFIALHGNGDNARNALACWRPIVSQGWVLAALQSSQIGYTDNYGWFDEERSMREIEEQYTALCEQQAIDAGQIILAGFSMGGAIALRMALQQKIPARGFILLGPGGPPIDTPEAWLPLIQDAAARGLRGCILLGEQDLNIPQDAIRTLAALLNTHGVACQIETIPGLGHGYPPDSGPNLTRALAFIQQ
jgi:predicted esterase